MKCSMIFIAPLMFSVLFAVNRLPLFGQIAQIFPVPVNGVIAEE